MALTEATAPAKVILFGEHAAVYGYPAIAVPVSQLRAKAVVQDGKNGVIISLENLRRFYLLEQARKGDPFAMVVHLVQKQLEIKKMPALILTISSDIPIAGGMGSGAATAAALMRALLEHFGQVVTPDLLATLTYEVERLHHGTPSGIDNTVVAYEKPVYFVKRQPQNLIEPFKMGESLRLLIADTGIPSSTKEVVGDVRRQWEAHPSYFEELFSQIGQIVAKARQTLTKGDATQTGFLMNQNHQLLEKMTVSHPKLELLAEQALVAGALGAKLSGAGRGGNLIALITPQTEEAVQEALWRGGAKQVIATTLA